jgi:hypothetical protein
MTSLMRRRILVAAGLALTFGASGPVEADILTQNTAETNSGTGIVGQSVTTESGGPFDNITFNFYSDVPATTPTAAGHLFILTSEYLGTPSALSSATPGFLAESTGIIGGVYQFASSLTLQGSTQYFVYEDTSFLTSGGGNGYAGGQLYELNGSGNFVADPQSDSNFTLSGTPISAAVPEPSTALVAVVGAVAFLAYGWSRHRREHRRQAAA